MTQHIQIFENESWAEYSANHINNSVLEICEKKGFCSIMLTGGRGANLIYNFWADLISINYPLYFYFGDERCVEPDDLESNFFMVKNSLFKKGVPSQFRIERIHGEADNFDVEAKKYESILPKEMDILLLSIGDDAHVASIFPGDFTTQYSKSNVVVVTGPNPPNPRITITPKYFPLVKKIFCLVSGDSKSEALKNTFQSNIDNIHFPSRLVINSYWLIDKSAAKLIGEIQF